MCGIAGFCGKTSDNQKEIQKMCDQIIHRGPDDHGYWLSETDDVVLGHRRLSIIDLTPNASQPMISGSGRYVISYNGEVYNFRSLRSKLIAEGHISRFRSNSDTEVIVEAFEAYGLDAVKDMKGMFAIALYDRKDKTLHLLRDRVGEKPLYYGIINGLFAFASDLASLTVMEGFQNRISKEALSLYLRYKSVPQPFSIYEHIYKLLPGQILSIKPPFILPSFHTYWCMTDIANSQQKHPFAGTPEDACKELQQLLRNAISEQMISDVPLGAFLSGGIDSPLVVSIMQELSKDKINTFTIGFEDTACNEAEYAKDISMHLGTNHTELYVTEKELREVIPILPTIFSEPLADPAGIPNYLVSKLARKQVTVTLSGDGGDELFCGYDLYNRLENTWPKIADIPYQIRNTAGKLLQTPPLGKMNQFYNMGEYARLSNINQLHELHRCEHNYDAFHLVPDMNPISNYLDFPILQSDSKLLPSISDLAESRNPSLLDIKSNLLCRDQTGFMTDSVLNKVDRSGMAVSLENRMPLMDRDILLFSWSLPINYKSNDGINKKILKELLYQYVPKSLLDRPKHGFEVPLTKWLSGNELHDWADELIQNSYLICDGYLNKKTVLHLWNTFQKKHLYTLQIWYILQAEAWYRAHRR